MIYISLCFSFLVLGIYVAIVPILMEQSNQEIITLNNVNFTAITLKFLAAMQPNKTCLHHKALEL
jgi:archaellum biogenesis protein FlaJ (TadC family)